MNIKAPAIAALIGCTVLSGCGAGDVAVDDSQRPVLTKGPSAPPVTESPSDKPRIEASLTKYYQNFDELQEDSVALVIVELESASVEYVYGKAADLRVPETVSRVRVTQHLWGEPLAHTIEIIPLGDTTFDMSHFSPLLEAGAQYAVFLKPAAVRTDRYTITGVQTGYVSSDGRNFERLVPREEAPMPHLALLPARLTLDELMNAVKSS